ncbi:MAG: glycosyltransferase family 4 protein [Planctomycetes bacterium]|nr:glycosyltransferase family 4 protein [Planctomycetota bacterium]
MRIIQLTPGSGDNFYCENCLRDLTLVRAFQRAGHDITMVPMYLPINTGPQPFPSHAPIFFGGVNVYLQQKLRLFRKTPRWLDRFFDNSFLLNSVGKLAGMTSAKDLGQTTLSMLQGRGGKQLKELERLVDWLAAMDPKPEVIIVSNILLAGLAPSLKERLNIPVVCLLQDEEGFLDTLPKPYADQCWQLVRQHAASFDALICVSDYYQQVMQERLEIQADSMPVIPMGLHPAGFEPSPELPQVPTLGFLSKMSRDHGLDILINALHLLRRDDRLKYTMLRMTGGKGPGDRMFLKKMQNRINAMGLSNAVDYVDDYTDHSRKQFLQTISVMVLPARKPLAYGLFALEACAASRPFVLPDLGVFPELVEKTQAGVLYHPNNPVRLAEVLRSLLTDPQKMLQLGRHGRQAVETTYSIDKTVAKLTELFTTLCDNYKE